MAFYWGSLFVSISNLVLVAFERYVPVNLDDKYTFTTHLRRR